MRLTQSLISCSLEAPLWNCEWWDIVLKSSLPALPTKVPPCITCCWQMSTMKKMPLRLCRKPLILLLQKYLWLEILMLSFPWTPSFQLSHKKVAAKAMTSPRIMRTNTTSLSCWAMSILAKPIVPTSPQVSHLSQLYITAPLAEVRVPQVSVTRKPLVLYPEAACPSLLVADMVR